MAVIDHAMLHAQIKHGDTVVIQGSGPIGLLATACAKIGGAARVITTDKYNRKRLELAKEMGADLTLCHLDIENEKGRKEFIFENSLNLVGADVVINCVGHPMAFKECLSFVRDSGRLIEVGNFVDQGTIEFNPCRDLLEKGVTLIGSFDNEAEHYVRSMPLISDERIPLEKLITHTVPLGELQNVLTSIENQEKINGKEAVKVMIDPTMPERS
jgi:L-iditol 2-dehydrogenase